MKVLLFAAVGDHNLKIPRSKNAENNQLKVGTKTNWNIKQHNPGTKGSVNILGEGAERLKYPEDREVCSKSVSSSYSREEALMTS